MKPMNTLINTTYLALLDKYLKLIIRCLEFEILNKKVEVLFDFFNFTE